VNGTDRIVGVVMLGLVCIASIVGAMVLSLSGRPAEPTLTATASAAIGGLLALIPTAAPEDRHHATRTQDPSNRP
jgi:hypothetical protein